MHDIVHFSQVGHTVICENFIIKFCYVWSKKWQKKLFLRNNILPVLTYTTKIIWRALEIDKNIDKNIPSTKILQTKLTRITVAMVFLYPQVYYLFRSTLFTDTVQKQLFIPPGILPILLV